MKNIIMINIILIIASFNCYANEYEDMNDGPHKMMGKPRASQSTATNKVDIVESAEWISIKSNSIPDHEFQIVTPNEIEENFFYLVIPKNPVKSGQMTDLQNIRPVGLAINGVAMWNPYNKRKEDAVKDGRFDTCNGHTDEAGLYHYHQNPVCLTRNMSNEHDIVGYAVDGFKIYNLYDPSKNTVSLDQCNGHEHDNFSYHYHITEKFPYIVGCLMGQVYKITRSRDEQMKDRMDR